MGSGPINKGPSQSQWTKLATEVVAGAVTGGLPKVAGAVVNVAIGKVADGFDAPPSLEPGSYGVNKQANRPQYSATGKISSADWADPARLMSKLTQNPHGKLRAQSSASCSASNLIGAALLSGGPDQAAALLDRVAKDSSLNLGPEEQKQLSGIADKIRNRTATFEDLNLAQELAYRAGNTRASATDLADQAQGSKKLSAKEKRLAKVLAGDGSDTPKLEKLLSKALGREVHLDSQGWERVSDKTRTKDISGLTDDELKDLGTSAAPGARPHELVAPGDTIEGIANDLKPGEVVTIRVAGNDRGLAPDHYVTVGRRKDGTFYLYNPDPSKGDATLVIGGKGPKADVDFVKRTDKYNDRMFMDQSADSLPPGLRYSP